MGTASEGMGAVRAAGFATRLRHLAELIRWEHTVFALPFAYIGVLLAADGWPGWPVAGWVLAAMVGGRTAAMALNRYIDRFIDARNPRTASRHIPRGLVPAWHALALAAVSLALLAYAAWQLNETALLYLPWVVVILVGYSYTKRFTWACHLVLGLSYFFVPFGGWIAVTNRVELPAVMLGIAAACWVAGFDIIYACQDVEWERQHGIHSIPVRFGAVRALRASQGLHVLTVLLLAAAGIAAGWGIVYFAGVAVVAALLVYEHRLVSPHDMTKLDKAFFTVNSILSLVFFAFVVAEVVL